MFWYDDNSASSSGQGKQSAALMDVSPQFSGNNPVVQQKGSPSSVNGYATNASCTPEQMQTLHYAVIIVLVATGLLVMGGAVVFRGHNL